MLVFLYPKSLYQYNIPKSYIFCAGTAGFKTEFFYLFYEVAKTSHSIFFSKYLSFQFKHTFYRFIPKRNLTLAGFFQMQVSRLSSLICLFDGLSTEISSLDMFIILPFCATIEYEI